MGFQLNIYAYNGDLIQVDGRSHGNIPPAGNDY